MPEEQILGYISENIRQGYSHKEIKEVMMKSGYTPDEIDHLFETLKSSNGEQLQSNSTSPTSSTLPQSIWVYIMGIIAIGTILFILATPIIFKSGFGKGGWLITYLLLLVLGTLGSFVVFKGINMVSHSAKRHIIGGVLAPLASVAAIIMVFWGKKRIMLLSLEKMATLNPGSANPISATLGTAHSPLIASLLFYLLTNAVLILTLIREKQYRELYWYALGIPLYIATWSIMVALASSYISSVVPL